MECDVLLSYTNTGSRISFTLHGKLEKDFYMAMGLSLDDKMVSWIYLLQKYAYIVLWLKWLNFLNGIVMFNKNL